MLSVNDFDVITAVDKPELLELTHEMAIEVWPEFLLNDPVSNKYWRRMHGLHPGFQFMLLEKRSGDIAAYGNSIPVHISEDLNDLPRKGWD